MRIHLMDFPTYEVDLERGFLPAEDPLQELPPGFEAWERLARQLPALLLTDRLRPALEHLPVLDSGRLESTRELERAMLLLSVLGNASVWAGEPPVCRVPAGVAVPWWEVAGRLGRPPIAAHASLVLHNWRRLDERAPLSLDNLALLQPFLGGMDEQWFFLVTAAIEAAGAPALPALVEAQEAVASEGTGRVEAVAGRLEVVAGVVARLSALLQRMPERCDPYIFYHRVRRWLAGWPAPGVVYEGVRDEPLVLYGGSAAQSSLLQALDAGLGIHHQAPEAAGFLGAMRAYMPPAHRRFLEALESGPSMRGFVREQAEKAPGLLERYEGCIGALERFRRLHQAYATLYIARQAPQASRLEGTGGTSFVPFLEAVRRETRESRLRQPGGAGEPTPEPAD
jgi:indoleamine 2,3-dioxygenase